MGMKNRMGPCNKVREFLHSFHEEALSAKEMQLIQAHLDQCPECAHQLVKLRQLVDLIQTHGNQLCPQPEEIYEYVSGLRSPDETAQLHLRYCSYRRKTAEELKPLPKGIVL